MNLVLEVNRLGCILSVCPLPRCEGYGLTKENSEMMEGQRCGLTTCHHLIGVSLYRPDMMMWSWGKGGGREREREREIEIERGVMGC